MLPRLISKSRPQAILLILLLWSPKVWDYRCEPSRWALMIIVKEKKNQCEKYGDSF